MASNRIAKLMEEKGVGVVALADRMGITRQTLHANLKNPSYPTLERIAEALGVELWELFADGREIAARYQEQAAAPDALRCPKCGARLTIHADD